MLDEPLPPVKYTRSAYTHASMRAPGAIYDEVPIQAGITILVGTKFANNTSMKKFQSNDRSVGCDYIYPTDGTAIERASLFGREYCWKDRLIGVCVEGECLANGPKACGGCKVEPEGYAELLSRWVETVGMGEKLPVPWHVACYYDSFEDAVVASNSLWKERDRWLENEGDIMGYRGYTECGSSVRITEINMADAVVVPLHRPESDFVPRDVCNGGDHDIFEQRLLTAYRRGYGDLPVLWYRESTGIKDVRECSEQFDGNGCEHSWHRDFFSQEYTFASQNCLVKPPGCDEVYFFPADGDNCSAYTNKGKKRRSRLCRAEKLHDARVAWEGMMAMEAPGMGYSQLTRFLERRLNNGTTNRGFGPPTIGGGSNSTTETSLLLAQPVAVDSSLLDHQSFTVASTSCEGLSFWINNCSFFLVGVILSFVVKRKIHIQFQPNYFHRKEGKR